MGMSIMDYIGYLDQTRLQNNSLISSSTAKLLSDICNEESSELFNDCKDAIEYSISNGDYFAEVSLNGFDVDEISKVIFSLQNRRGYNTSIDPSRNILSIIWKEEE